MNTFEKLQCELLKQREIQPPPKGYHAWEWWAAKWGYSRVYTEKLLCEGVRQGWVDRVIAPGRCGTGHIYPRSYFKQISNQRQNPKSRSQTRIPTKLRGKDSYEPR